MNQFCANCGAPLNKNSNFCNTCGMKSVHQADPSSAGELPSLTKPNPGEGAEPAPRERKQTKKKNPENRIQDGGSSSIGDENTVNVVAASPVAGEMRFISSVGAAFTVVSPFKCVLNGLSNAIRNLKTVFQDKKRLIPALVLSGLWILLIVLPMLGLNPIPVKGLSAITFAFGGYSNDPFRMLGGLVGKGIVAVLFMSFFSGGALKGLGKGVKVLFASLKSKGHGERVTLLLGMGIGLILFNLISGYANLLNSMAGIAALLLTLRSLGRNSGFLVQLVGSFMAKKKNGTKMATSALVNQVIAGMAAGLFLSVPLSLIPFVYLPYCVGAVFFLGALILNIINSRNKKQITAAVLLVALGMTLLFPVVSAAVGSDDEWAGTWTLKKVIVNDKSAGLADYYAATPADLTRETVEITATSYDHEFRYTGEEYKSDIVHLQDGEYVPIHYHKGEFFKTRITFDTPPKYLREDQRVTFPVKFDVYDSYIEYFDYMRFNVSAVMEVYAGKEISKKTRVHAPFPPANFNVDGKLNQKLFDLSTYTPYGLTNGELMGFRITISPTDLMMARENISHTDAEEEMTKAEIIYLYEWKYGVNNFILNTDASEGPGETDVSVPTAIVVSVLGVLTTLGAAGATASGSDNDNTDEKGSTYKMVLYKEFGNAIRYNDPAVAVYARMVEITKEGTEVSRMDLTQQIQIVAGSPAMKVRDQQVAGEYTGAFVEAEAAGNTGNPTEGIVSFQFTGEGGSFQNNVTFRLVGEPYIEYQSSHNNQIYILASSAREFILQCVPMDFMHSPTLTMAPSQSELFDIRLEQEKENTYRVIVTDKAVKPEIVEKFYQSFRIELTAENDQNEIARSHVEVIVCYEGLVPDWHGKEKEIRAYYTDREKKEMVKTVIGFSIGVWNNEKQSLDINPAGDLDITVTDEKDLCKTIGVSWETDPNDGSETVTNYWFTAEKPFPSENPADIELKAKSGELTYSTPMKLIPDEQQYADDLKQEYERCLYIIETYMEGELREKRLEQCKQTWGKFGIEDYQGYRRQVWKSAENQILQKRESYLSAAAYADTAIVALEFAKNVGDIALDMALAPIGGPFASILIGQAKDSVLELVDMYVNDKLYGDGLKEFLSNRMAQMIGMMDNFFDPPKPEDANFTKKMVIWFTCYFIYRAGYHLMYDKDENGNPAGITEGLKAACQDMTIKAVMVAFMGDVMDKEKPNSTVAKMVDKTGYSKKADSELAEKVLSTATTVAGYINSLLG